MTAGPLWRSYDQAALDRQLNLRARTPEHPAFFARWAEESAAIRRRVACRLDLAYGAAAGERLDLFPAAEAGAPLLAFIHGGYWQALDKGDFSFLAPPFVREGVSFASLNYDLAPGARIPEMVEEIRRALAWLGLEAGRLGFDPRRIVVAGHSAGGHLATMALATDWGERGLPRDFLAGGCSVSGIYELEPLHLSYQQPVLQLDPASVAAASPLRQVPRDGRPLVLAVGGDEPEEFLMQQAEFAGAWRAAGHPLRQVDLPGRHHFSAVEALGEPGHELFRLVLALLKDGRLA